MGIFGLFVQNHPDPAMLMDEILLLSATELARRIREGELSSREAVQAHIGRIQQVNGQLNAVVQDRFEAALVESDAADRLQRSGADLPRFHGVPCTIKECFAFEGMPQSGGLVSRKGLLAPSDAPAVRRLRNSGAISLGATNLSELCMWMESSNRVYGRTSNPYGLDRTVGGSSGGEGAIVGAGGSPFGLGSDIGGSIRMPAFFNGVFGHKPSSGLVPNHGQHPVAENKAMDYLCTGPICRRAGDLLPLLEVLSGRDLARPPRGLSGLRIVNIPDDGLLGVDPELRNVQSLAAAWLESQGAVVEEVRFPELRNSVEMWSALMAEAGGTTFEEHLFEGKRRSLAAALFRWSLGGGPHTFPALALVGIERLNGVFSKRLARFAEQGRAFRRTLEDRVGTGVFLYPSHAVPAPKHGRSLLFPVRWAYTAVLNIMEVPVTQVPLGLGSLGLPLGVQVGAGHGSDALAIEVALALESEFGGWSPSSLL
jgi:fatty acid amide hydrolase 2